MNEKDFCLGIACGFIGAIVLIFIEILFLGTITGILKRTGPRIVVWRDSLLDRWFGKVKGE